MLLYYSCSKELRVVIVFRGCELPRNVGNYIVPYKAQSKGETCINTETSR
jgi:hypothetical protein